MTNNYTLFSEIVEDLTEKEIKWLDKVLSIDPEELDSETFDAWSKNGLYGVTALDPCFWPDFEWSFEKTPEWTSKDGQFHPETTYLWVYSEAWGNIENVVVTIQEFLKRFRPNGCWSMEYAMTCSVPRIGEFGGGGVFVTANKMTWISPSMQLSQMMKDWKEKQE